MNGLRVMRYRVFAILAATGVAVVGIVGARLRLGGTPLRRSPVSLSTQAADESPEALLAQGRPFSALWQAGGDLTGDQGVVAARALTHAGFAERAITGLRRRLRRSPSESAARTALAEAALAVARPAEAVAALADGDRDAARTAAVQLLVGDARFASGDFAGASSAYHAAKALDPDAAAADARLGQLALARGDWQGAKQAFSDARNRDPGCLTCVQHLAEAFWEAGEREDAERLWRELTITSPGFAPAHLALGRVLADRRSWQEAVGELVMATRSEPPLPEAQRELASVMEKMGQRSSALYQWGQYYLQTDRPDEALVRFRQMASLNPQSRSAPLMASFCSMQMQQMDAAASAARQGLVGHPGDAALRQRLAMLHLLTGNGRAAERLAREWLREGPSAEAHRILGHAAFNEARFAVAIQEYEQCLALDAAHVEALLEVSQARLATGDSLLAVNHLRRAIEQEPRRADLRLSLGLALQRLGQHDASHDALLKALDLDASQTAAAAALAKTAATLRRPHLAQRFSDLADDMQSRNRQRDLLRRILGREPTNATARRQLADWYITAGDLRRASDQWSQVVELLPNDDAARSRLAAVRRLLRMQ